MCLVTDKKKTSIAKRDITVFKSVVSNKDNTRWHGPIYDEFSFPFNEIVTAKDRHNIEIDSLDLKDSKFNANRYYINEGLYSTSSIFINSSDHICICIIPKGSEYCRGYYSEMVSLKIIVFSSYKEYFKYRWKKLLKLFRQI